MALVTVVSLAGCSSPDEPSTVPRTTPPATTTSPSPSPTSTEDQVEAAVRAYYAELVRAGATNDASRLKKLVHESCPCYNAVKVIEGHAARGERSTDSNFDLQLVHVHDVTGKVAAAEVRYKVDAYLVVDSSGDTVAEIKAQTGHFDLSLAQTKAGWIIINLFDLEG
jgi:cytoskeletal protein RodZ